MVLLSCKLDFIHRLLVPFVHNYLESFVPFNPFDRIDSFNPFTQLGPFASIHIHITSNYCIAKYNSVLSSCYNRPDLSAFHYSNFWGQISFRSLPLYYYQWVYSFQIQKDGRSLGSFIYLSDSLLIYYPDQQVWDPKFQTESINNK